MRKRRFEDYEEMALIIRTVIHLLQWLCAISGRVRFANEVCKLLDKVCWVRRQLEEELFRDYPEKAKTEMFYGGKEYKLDIRKHRDYIYSSFSKKTCIDNDAFIMLTKQGVVLASDDARINQEEDGYLYNLNKKLIERKERE